MLSSALLIVMPATVLAQPRLEIDLGAFGSSNPFLLPGEDELTVGADVEVRAANAVSLNSRTMAEANGRIGVRQYSRRFGQFWTGRGAGALRHRRNEFLSFDTDAYYERVLPAEALAESVDAAIDPVSIRENYGASHSVLWRPNARTSVRGLAAWATTGPTRLSPLPRTSAFDFTLGIERRVSEVLTLGGRGQYTVSDSPLGGDAVVAAFRLTATRRLRGNWRGEVELGIEREAVALAGGGRDSGPARFSGRGILCVEPERTSLCVSSGLRSVLSGLGLQRELSFGAVLRRRTAERGTLVLNADYRQAPIASSDRDAEVLAVGSTYEHQVGRQFHVFGGVDYLRRGQPTGGDIDAVGGRVGISFRKARS